MLKSIGPDEGAVWHPVQSSCTLVSHLTQAQLALPSGKLGLGTWSAAGSSPLSPGLTGHQLWPVSPPDRCQIFLHQFILDVHYVYVYEGSSISIFPHSKSVYDLTHWHWHHTKSYKILNELDAMKLEENRTITAYALYERLKTKFGYIWPKIFQFDHLWPSMTRFNQAFQFDPTDDLW